MRTMLHQTPEADEMTKKQKSANANNEKLARLMVKHEITRPEAAEIMGVTKSCVDQWLRPEKSHNWRPMPDRSLRLFEFELGLRRPSYTYFDRTPRA
jgi:hypothetical protein